MTALIGEQYLNTAPYEQKTDESGKPLEETRVEPLPCFEYQRPAVAIGETSSEAAADAAGGEPVSPKL
jgi:hypothetical protein